MLSIEMSNKGVNSMANNDIRKFAKGSDVPLWKVAKELNISEPTMSRRLREELPDTEKTKFRKIITNIANKEQRQ